MMAIPDVEYEMIPCPGLAARMYFMDMYIGSLARDLPRDRGSRVGGPVHKDVKFVFAAVDW